MEVFRRAIEEAFGRGNLAVLDEMMAPEYAERQDGLPPDRQGLKAVIAELPRIFPVASAAGCR